MARLRLKKQYLLMLFEAVQTKERGINRKLKQLKRDAKEANACVEELETINELELELKRYAAIKEVIYEASKKKDSILDENLGPDKVVVITDDEDNNGYDIYTHLID